MKQYLITKFRKFVGFEKLYSIQNAVIEELSIQSKKLDEINKALLFQSTILDSIWLKNRSFTPGGYAVDFYFLLNLYRILNNIKPNKIVEFGSGQTTKMISQYCDFYSCQAFVFEHDENWLQFCKESFELSNKLGIQLSPIQSENYKGHDTLRYSSNIQKITGDDIDFILLDGPIGSDGFSRVQILDLIPDSLNKDRFCILIDDYQRTGEKNTTKEIMNILDENNIKYLHKDYCSDKTHYLLCSRSLSYLTSL